MWKTLDGKNHGQRRRKLIHYIKKSIQKGRDASDYFISINIIALILYIIENIYTYVCVCVWESNKHHNPKFYWPYPFATTTNSPKISQIFLHHICRITSFLGKTKQNSSYQTLINNIPLFSRNDVLLFHFTIFIQFELQIQATQNLRLHQIVGSQLLGKT